jgi:hypothetical protein
MAKAVFTLNGVSVFAPSDAGVVTVSKHAKPHILLNGVELKHCARCNSWKRLSRFYVSVSNWDGLQAFCKSCREELNAVQAEVV